ncbi:Chaperone DnaJ-domain superfamily protein [Striga hermonthica]|uniref:Chaperone DnaJ-domain superfamily protein n=1 Tax=Striga hermonthica TaxID=68872 RepID=A0A9N7RQJ1_STRHE|nr:Chaperone DnaJ-domain superfamily protein [Striga hermonthica]
MSQHSTGLKKGASEHVPSPPTTNNMGHKNGLSSNLNEQNVGSGEELPNGIHSSTKGVEGIDVQDAKNSKKKTKKTKWKVKKAVNEAASGHEVPLNDNIEADKTDMSTAEGLGTKDGSDLPQHFSSENANNSESFSNGLHNEEGRQHVVHPETLVFKFLRNIALSVARSSADWIERHKPTFVTLKSKVLKACDHIRMKIQHVQPIIFQWIVHFGNLMLLVFMVWLDCTLRGIDSFLRMGTTSFFSIIWCTVLSVIAIIGLGKSLVALAVIAAGGLFLGITFAALVSGIFAIFLVWFYGSLWPTGLIIVLGGLALITNHDRIGLLIASAYSIYCVWNYVGWLGLLLGLNLSFISSDALLYVLRNIANDQRTANGCSEQAAGFQGQPSFSPDEHFSPGTGAAGLRTDRGPGIPSTSGSDSEITSEDEIVRLLNCKDHYDALGLARFENIDLLVIKREYRKKAMLVHPDKNMGNEKAAEAFQKLQNAYEVLLDASKRKEYDDELKREELLNFFRKLQNTSPENRSHGIFRSGFGRSEADGEDPPGELKRIACKKCGFFHTWASTKKIKSRARWCQDCKDFHQAKDGDGWVEQSSQPIFFGMLQQVEAPCAFVCAGGKVYDATEWFICQGMRCPANTHKPSFQVNTSVVAKNNNSHAKGSSSWQSSGQRMPAHNNFETMTEEEFCEWLQNAVQSGMFDNFTDGESPSKTGGSNSGSGSSKRKKKGKKQW